MLKLSRTALKELRARYLNILKKCAYLNASVLIALSVGSHSANAAPITTLSDFIVAVGGETIDPDADTTKQYTYVPRANDVIEDMAPIDAENVSVLLKPVDLIIDGRDVTGEIIKGTVAIQMNTASDSGSLTFNNFGYVDSSISIESLTKENADSYITNTSGSIFSAVIASNTDLNIKSSVLAGSNATGNSNQEYGAAVSAYNSLGLLSNAIIENSIFVDNITTNNGAALNFDNVDFNISSSKFVGNQALTGHAGAVDLAGRGELTNNIFYNNKAGIGGALYVHPEYILGDAEKPTTVSTSGNEYTKNEATTIGGAIYNEGSLTITNDTFNSNKAGLSGGAIYNKSDATITIEKTDTDNQTSFKDNSVEGVLTETGIVAGGAIYNEGSITINEQIEFIKGTDENSTGNTVSVTLNATSGGDEATAQALGGAIYNKGDISFNKHAVFSDNNVVGTVNGGTVSALGGAIYNEGTIDFVGSNNTDVEFLFYQNTAATSGGAIYNKTGTITFSDGVSFEGNKAARSGGAIYNEADIIFNDTASFSSNSNATNGIVGVGVISGSAGAIYNNGGSFTFNSDANFTSNKSGTSGGAIINNSAGDFTFNSNANFTSNQAVKNGGAVYNEGTINFVDQNNNTVEFLFSQNKGTLGGAIYNSGEITFSGGRTTFSENTSVRQNGGAIYNKGTTTFAGDTKFKSNHAGSGGAIYNNAGSISFNKNTNFESNSSAEKGGAIYNENEGQISFSTDNAFTSNQARLSGGAIYNENESQISFSRDNAFTSNQAGLSGGAIYNKGKIEFLSNLPTGTISQTTFTSNSITSTISESETLTGGAVHNEGIMEFNGKTTFG